MSDESIYLVMELWVKPDSFNQLKIFKRRVNEVLNIYSPEHIHHSHAIEWVAGDLADELPAGIEIIKLQNRKMAMQAINDLNINELKDMEKKLFGRVRAYLSRIDFSENLLKGMGL